MKKFSKKGKPNPVIWSGVLGLVVFFASLCGGSLLMSGGIIPESAMAYVGGVSLFLTVALGAMPVASQGKKKLLTALIYGLSWAVGLLALHLLFWQGSLQWWPLVAILAGSLMAGMISSRPKKLAY